MKKLILVAAITALTSTLAVAQTTNNSGGTNNNGGGDCNALRNSANVGAGAQWTAEQSKPYMERMTKMGLKTKAEGKFTDEDFNAACQAGAFKDMK